MKEYLLEIVIMGTAFIISIISTILSRLKLSFKNNKMLKIIDTLMIIAEYTNLEGEEKKAFVLKLFEDFKIGKVDNIDEYIDDKIKLTKGVNIGKKALEYETKTKRIYPPKTSPITMDKLEQENNYLRNMLNLREKTINDLNEQLEGGKNSED